MIKIVVADMDGTSLGPNEAISEKNIETILKVIDSGRDFVFASGRPTFGMNGIIKKAGLEDKVNYFIAYNIYQYKYAQKQPYNLSIYAHYEK